jgi:methionyl-tRNA formyltransferase
MQICKLSLPLNVAKSSLGNARIRHVQSSCVTPNYRGAAPINWAIINGETKTGVTTFFIDDKIDTGAMILSSEIDSNENAGHLHDRLMHLGSETVINTLELIERKCNNHYPERCFRD